MVCQSAKSWMPPEKPCVQLGLFSWRRDQQHGSGKGTQARLLANDFNLVHISVGDIFRWNVDTLEIQPRVLLSTPQGMRLPLTWIGILYDQVEADLAASSGIHTAQDALKMLMVGASVTMMCSALRTREWSQRELALNIATAIASRSRLTTLYAIV